MKKLIALLILIPLTAYAAIITGSANTASITGGTINNTTIGGTTPASAAFTLVTMGSATATGISTGEIGFPNSAALRWRNAANDAYRNVLYLDSSDNLQLGGGGATNNTVIAVAGAGTIATFSTTGLAVTGNVKASTTLSTGASTLTLTTGAVGLSKMTASASAPGAGGAKLELVCGTNAGTAKLIMYAGTSGTAVTVLDNVGAGVTGC